MRSRSRMTAAAVLVAALLSLAATGCCTTSTSGGGKIVASVNGQEIGSSEIQQQVDSFKKTSPTMFQGAAGAKREMELRAQLLQNLIDQELIKQAGKNLGVSVASKAVDDYIANLAKAYGGQKNLEATLRRSDSTMARLRASVAERMLRDAIGNALTKTGAPTEAQIKAYYDQNLPKFESQTMVHLAHILVDLPDKALAQDLYKQVNGGADIAGLAKQYSIDNATKLIAGDRGWALLSKYPPAFAKVVGPMQPGDVALARDQFGWHVVKMIAVQPGRQKPLEEVRAQIVQIITEQARTTALNDYLAGLRKKADLRIPDSQLKKAFDEAATTSATAGF